MLHHNGFVAGVCALTHGAHPVQRRNPKRRSEIAVGSAARRRFLKRKTQFARKRPSLADKARPSRASAPSAAD